MWVQSVFNAISEVNHNFPGLVNKVSELDPTGNDWTEQDWKDYNNVAAAIVEPFVFPDGESEDEEFYYSKTDEEGYGMVKGQIDSVDNSEAWKKMCDLIEKIGY